MSSDPRPCRGCGTTIVFAEGPNGKAIPLDMKAPVYQLVDGKAIAAPEHHVSHFSTCPEAKRFSGSKARS